MRVNDVHSQLNETTVARVVRVTSLEVLRGAIREAAVAGVSIIVAGSRHAMGGQQFVRGGWVLDMRPLKRVLMLDRERGLVTVEAGIEWPDLIAELERLQPHARATDPAPWSIVQKQTGADRLTLGGALAANIHGRGLQFAPIVSNVESFLLVDADGEMRTCSRTENVELFRGAIGGYGLLGVIAAVTLRLQRRYQIIRRVEIRDTYGLIDAFNRRIGENCTFGDFQFATDATHDSFLRTGVFSCYQRADAAGHEADAGRCSPRRISVCCRRKTGAGSRISRTWTRAARSRCTRGITCRRRDRSTGRTRISSRSTSRTITRISTRSRASRRAPR